VDKSNFTFSDLEQWFDERRVTEIECLVPDLTGVARGKILPREKFTEDRGMRLPQATVAMGVTGEFPEEGPYYDVISPTDMDMHLRPDPSTVRIVPWATDPTATRTASWCRSHLARYCAAYATCSTPKAGRPSSRPKSSSISSRATPTPTSR
jgi:glutamine synthetase